MRSSVGITLTAAAIAILFFGCAAAKRQVVVPGDGAAVQFTCLFPNGEVAISTDQAVGADLSLPKSPIFLDRNTSLPLNLEVPDKTLDVEAPEERGFEGEVVHQISKAIVGLKTGEKKTLEVKAQRLIEHQKGEHILKVARVRQAAREMRFTPEGYKAQTGNAAEVGRAFIIYPEIPGKIESVSATEVVVRFYAEAGQRVATGFGPGVVRVLPDQYEIVIDTGLGKLVRSGRLIGRVIHVDEKTITLDYSHPFGGETLKCDVLIESVVRQGVKMQASRKE